MKKLPEILPWNARMPDVVTDWTVEKNKALEAENNDLREALKKERAKSETIVCTCPSGDGSLRWPCPVHPPVERNPESAEMPQHYSAGDLDPDAFVYKRSDVVAMWKAMEGRFEPYEGLVARLRHQVDSLQEKLADKVASHGDVHGEQ